MLVRFRSPWRLVQAGLRSPTVAGVIWPSVEKRCPALVPPQAGHSGPAASPPPGNAWRGGGTANLSGESETPTPANVTIISHPTADSATPERPIQRRKAAQPHTRRPDERRLGKACLSTGRSQ